MRVPMALSLVQLLHKLSLAVAVAVVCAIAGAADDTVSMKSKGERNNNGCNTNGTTKKILFSSAPFSFCVSFCASSSGHGASSVPYPSHRRARTAVRGSRTWRP
jgi:hypothetical protein